MFSTFLRSSQRNLALVLDRVAPLHVTSMRCLLQALGYVDSVEHADAKTSGTYRFSQVHPAEVDSRSSVPLLGHRLAARENSAYIRSVFPLVAVVNYLGLPTLAVSYHPVYCVAMLFGRRPRITIG